MSRGSFGAGRSHLSWRRMSGLAVVALLAGLLWYGSGPLASALAQDAGAEALEEPPPAAAPLAAPGGQREPSLLARMFSGGWLGVPIVLLILLISIVAVAFIVEHSMSIRHSTLMPEPVLAELEQLLAQGKVNEAVEYCQLPENYSLVSNCVLAGLERFKTSEFGFAEYRSAVEEEGENQTGKLYRKTEVLGVIGAIAPMLGLTGTVLGMILAFDKIAATGGMARPEDLAGGIGTALFTTLLGLVVAIPSMIAFSFFRNRIDSIVAESGKRIERIMAPLGRQGRGAKVTG